MAGPRRRGRGRGRRRAEWETDRGRFLGRGRDVRDPAAVGDGRPLSGTVGAVLDPVVSLRRRVRLRPGAVARLTFTTFVVPSRDVALDLADKYRDPAAFERAATLAWSTHRCSSTTSAWTWRRRDSSRASRARSSSPTGRSAPPPTWSRERAADPSRVWVHDVSGDLPIVLFEVEEAEDVATVRQLLRVHA